MWKKGFRQKNFEKLDDDEILIFNNLWKKHFYFSKKGLFQQQVVALGRCKCNFSYLIKTPAYSMDV